MNTWQILQIEPTTDLWAIKKAYAKRSREVHPEEKPEEFIQLHEAYQNALTYVKGAEMQEREDNIPEIPVKNDSDIFIFISEQQNKLQENLEEFLKQWDAITKLNYLSPVMERWIAYMKSEDFRKIRWNPLVLELLEQKIEMLDISWEARLALWNAYGFKAENYMEYQGDVLWLFEALLPDYDRRKWKELKKEEQERLERIKAEEKGANFIKTFFKPTLFLFCVVMLIIVCVQIPAESHFVLAEMRNRYAADSFTNPKKTETLLNGNTVYTFYARSHPELEIQATVSRDLQSGYILQEDYGLKLLRYYGEQYGIEFDVMEGYREHTKYNSYGSFREYIILYSHIENVDSICDNLFKLLGEVRNGELSYLDSVGICWEDALYPETMVGGGVQNRPPAQIYIVEELNDKEDLKKSVKAAHVDYMYHYEAWNLTPEQHAAFGSAYVSRGRAAREEESGNPWSSNSTIRSIEEEFDFYIPIFEKKIYDEETDIPNAHGYKDYSTGQENYITIGNAYQLLKASGTEVHVKEDGSGFIVEKDGVSSTFGKEPEQELDIVLGLLTEPEEDIVWSLVIQDMEY